MFHFILTTLNYLDHQQIVIFLFTFFSQLIYAYIETHATGTEFCFLLITSLFYNNY